MIIKATRLQAWAPAGGGGKSRPWHPPPLENKKKVFLAILRAFFATFSSYGGFLARFSHFWGPFHHVEAILLLFTSWWGSFFGLAPSTKISAGAHDCKEGSRSCSPEIFLFDRNLVSSGHVLLRFCLKNDKNNDKL